MSDITDFGKYLRKLRIDHNVTLRKMALELDISPGYLSAIELGKRMIPSDLIYKIQNIYHLSELETQDLEKLAINKANNIQVNLEDANEKQKEVFLAFARQFDGLNEAVLDKLFKILKDVKRGGNVSKIYSYTVMKGNLKYVRVVGGALVENLGLDYQNATLEDLQKTAAVALQHLKDIGADCSKQLKKHKNLMLYRGGSHIKLVVDGDISNDLGLFYVLDVTESILPDSKDIYINEDISV